MLKSKIFKKYSLLQNSFFWSNLPYVSMNYTFLGWYSAMVQVAMLANCSFAWFCSSICQSVSNKNKSYLLFRNEIDNILHYISKLNCSFADITNILLHYEILRYMPILPTMKSWKLYHFICTYLYIFYKLNEQCRVHTYLIEKKINHLFIKNIQINDLFKKANKNT